LIACLSKTFHELRFTSGAALLCLAPFITAIIGKALVAFFNPDGDIQAPPASSVASFEGFLLASPLLASAFCCHFSILDIDAEMQPCYRGSIFGVIHCVSLGVLPVTYALVSLAGVALFGADTPENVLVAFHGDRAMQLARGVLSLTNALRMPLIAMPLHRLLQELCGSACPAAAKEGRPLVAMTLLLMLSLAAACHMRVLTRVLGLLGGTGGVLSCYCLPGLMYLALLRSGGGASRPWALAAVAAICVGALVAVAGALTWA